MSAMLVDDAANDFGSSDRGRVHGHQAHIADDAEVGPYSDVIGPNVVLGSRTKIGSHVVIDGHTEIGADCSVHAFAALGDAPQHSGHNGEPTRLAIGARNLIRRACHHALWLTAMGHWRARHGRFGRLLHGRRSCSSDTTASLVITSSWANNATLGGHAVIGDFVIMGGLSAAHQNIRIGRHAFVGGMAGVNHDVIPFGNVWGNHAHLEGLNLVGLKRRGFSREAINTLRAAYRMLFAEEGTFRATRGHGDRLRRFARGHGNRRVYPRRRQSTPHHARAGDLDHQDRQAGAYRRWRRPAGHTCTSLPGHRPSNLRHSPKGICQSRACRIRRSGPRVGKPRRGH